jgi:hypothetical protein
MRATQHVIHLITRNVSPLLSIVFMVNRSLSCEVDKDRKKILWESFNPFKMLGHHSASKASVTSRLVIITIFLVSNSGSMYFFFSFHCRVCSAPLQCKSVLTVCQLSVFVLVVVNSCNKFL